MLLRSRKTSPTTGDGVRIGDILLRNRVVTSSSLLGYGVAGPGLVPYGMSPVSRFVPLAEFGAVTTRTLTVEPREGHFTTRDDWPLRELPALLRRYIAEALDALGTSADHTEVLRHWEQRAGVELPTPPVPEQRVPAGIPLRD